MPQQGKSLSSLRCIFCFSVVRGIRGKQAEIYPGLRAHFADGEHECRHNLNLHRRYSTYKYKSTEPRGLEYGHTQLVHERFLLEDRVFPIALHLCDVPICGEVPDGGACVRVFNIHTTRGGPRTFRKASPRAQT
jgi:hypothetical protein